MPPWLTLASTVATVLGTLITAIATVFLWRVTRALAVETKRLVEMGNQPHIVATIEPSQWSMMHADLRVVNTGNATAYDVKVSFDPELMTNRSGAESAPAPLQAISVLRPGQGLSTSIGEVSPFLDEVRIVETSWKRNAADGTSEVNKYVLDMTGHKGLTRLGGGDALTQLVLEVRKLREDWHAVARGSRRLSVNNFDASDRAKEDAEQERWFNEVNLDDADTGSSSASEGTTRSEP